MIRQMVGRLVAVLLALLFAADISAADFSAERRKMLEEITQLTAATAAETGRKTLDPRILDAMAKIPREAFVPPKQAASAYQSRPLSIGHGQTISQPFIVALMTELLSLKPTDRVLEVGTGSGYQAAVLSLLAREVYTIEIIPALGNAAAATLRRLGYANVKSKVGDGYQGWPTDAPFDAIIVTAAPDHIPAALVDQLKPHGRMVIPVGGAREQALRLITKNPDGTTTTTDIIPVNFVPLVNGDKKL
jgi:protein-L-isoaspartate(D-aspartate) O-methyltransferase